jgi:hypothetical protein
MVAVSVCAWLVAAALIVGTIAAVAAVYGRRRGRCGPARSTWTGRPAMSELTDGWGLLAVGHCWRGWRSPRSQGSRLAASSGAGHDRAGGAARLAALLRVDGAFAAPRVTV